MANKSGKKLAPTKKEWEPSASRLAGGGEGAVLIPPVPLIQEDSGSFPFLSVHSFSRGVRKMGSCARHLIRREEASG